MPTSKQYWHDFPMRKLDIIKYILVRDLSLLYALRIGILRCTSVDASLIHITIQGSKLEAINPILRTKIVTNKEGPFR